MKQEALLEVIDKLTGNCYPDGNEYVDDERYENLLAKIAIVKSLIDQIEDAGENYDTHKTSSYKIVGRAIQYLTELRDRLNEIDYLPKLKKRGRIK